MAVAFEYLYSRIRNWAKVHSIEVEERRLSDGKAGEFNGLVVIMNRAYEPEERAYYLAHALGSTVRWSLDKIAVQEIFEELRTAKKNRETEPSRLDRAIGRYRTFESESSAFAVWVLAELGSPDVISSYTNFMRADLEAMTEFHQHGRAPVWRVFFARWNEGVAHGGRRVIPFDSKPIPLFHPIRVERQEILQRRDDDS